MPKTVWQAPSHHRENAKGFRNVRQHDYKEANCRQPAEKIFRLSKFASFYVGTLMSMIFD